MSKAKHYRAKSNAYGELSKGPETTHGLRAGGIDEFVHRTLLSGFLHKNEVLAHYLPEFARTFSRDRGNRRRLSADQNQAGRRRVFGSGPARTCPRLG
jgi:hypothetical protein